MGNSNQKTTTKNLGGLRYISNYTRVRLYNEMDYSPIIGQNYKWEWPVRIRAGI